MAKSKREFVAPRVRQEASLADATLMSLGGRRGPKNYNRGKGKHGHHNDKNKGRHH